MNLRITVRETLRQPSGSIRRSVSSSILIAANRKSRRAHKYAPKKKRILRKRRRGVANGRKTTIQIPRQGVRPTADSQTRVRFLNPSLIAVVAGGGREGQRVSTR